MTDRLWLLLALVSAAAAALTAVFAKIGVDGVPVVLATAVRTVVVGGIAWALVFALEEHHMLASISRRSWLFLVVSGVATGVSWLAYFRALQLAPASRVAPIDKLSLPIAIVLSSVLLGETIGWKVVVGVTLMTLGALLTIA